MAYIFRGSTLDDVYRGLLQAVLREGAPIEARALPALEMRNVIIELTEPLRAFSGNGSLHIPGIVARQMQFLCGQEDDAILSQLEPRKDPTRRSAIYKYGELNRPAVRRQLARVGRLLARDNCSRQAVVSVYRMNPTASITMYLQFFVREAALHCSAFLRSNDLWNGIATDAAMIAFVQARLASELNIGLGEYVHYVGSAHVYMADVDVARGFADGCDSGGVVEYAPPKVDFGLMLPEEMADTVMRTLRGFADGTVDVLPAALCEHQWFRWAANVLAEKGRYSGHGCRDCT